MKILITGANGFVGRNLISELKNKDYTDLYEYDIDSDLKLLEEYTKDCEFVFHLAGVNRPKEEKEFMEGNFGFTSKLLENLKKNNNKSPILITSSIQATLENPYGKSKKAGEDLLFEYSNDTDVQVFVYRLPNLFGKWSRPNYNSVVATFCNNIARGIEILVNNPEAELTLCYIDDVLKEFAKAMNGEPTENGNYCSVPITYTIKLGELAERLLSFRHTRESLSIPDMADEFNKKLYSTYLSYLPEDDFSYQLKMNSDYRGSFTEFLKTPDKGQVSINVSKPRITKGNHWHHTKNEKFLVVSGNGMIRFRKIGTNEVIEYRVSGEKLEVVDIPAGYTHNIENTGETDMVTIIWVSECYDSDNPDTYYLEV